MISRMIDQPAFSLAVTVANLAEPASQEDLPIQKEVEGLLVRSPLAASQWSIRRLPPPPPGSQIPAPATAEPATAPAVRVEMRVFQEM